ncbi:hypothetical protein QBC43DRAFT_194257, partial [Cladorrhinum sp. PSN259]
ELLDIYRSHKATILHDKLIALFGMASDNLAAVGIEPDYSTPWEVLLKRVSRHLLGDLVSIKT